MTSTLESVEWGERALSLLAHCSELENGKPAVMIIRHSEVDYQTMEDLPIATLTETGIAAALEFGTKLPSNRARHTFNGDISVRVICYCAHARRLTPEGEIRN